MTFSRANTGSDERRAALPRPNGSRDDGGSPGQQAHLTQRPRTEKRRDTPERPLASIVRRGHEVQSAQFQIGAKTQSSRHSSASAAATLPAPARAALPFASGPPPPTFGGVIHVVIVQEQNSPHGLLCTDPKAKAQDCRNLCRPRELRTSVPRRQGSLGRRLLRASGTIERCCFGFTPNAAVIAIWALSQRRRTFRAARSPHDASLGSRR